MNISEEKWSIQQTSQVPPPQHQHSPQMNGMPTENFMQPFPYESQATQGQMHSQQIFVSMSTPATPTTPRQNDSPNINSTTNTQNSAPDRKIDNRPTFTSFHAAPFQPSVRKLDRGFFLADNDWTCYRRNYFQISSAFSISNATHPVNEADVPCLLEVEGQFHTVTQFLLGITARVSNSDKKIELVQHTPKRDKGPQMVPVPKSIRPGGNLNLSSVGSNSNIVTFERIQFKTATANNGKRRAAQQYYVVMVDLYAQAENGEQYRVATSTSAPLVVRGRSPGHYADNHDRYNPMGMNPAFPNDRHIGFPHPTGPNGSVMPQDFNGGPFPGPYGQYPPFQGFPPVTGGPIRNDALLMMAGPNGQTPPFHPQHPHQQYMVPAIGDAENQNPEVYNNPNMDPNIVNGSHDQKVHQNQQIDMHMEGATTSAPHSAFSSFESRPMPNANSNVAAVGGKPFMKIEIPQSSELPDHPLTSPAYHSQEYVEGLHFYHTPANSASAHHGGYHSDSEQHHSNGVNQENGRPTRSDEPSEHNSNQPHSPQVNGDKSEHGSKSPSTTSSVLGHMAESVAHNVALPFVDLLYAKERVYS
ncbi:17844_t:CDS:2 [Gigaspora margarita]|uniref:17844_t:CDS:1 n=1 Tax=Gigaspora margarita TaxID=4874 RepID=A0ABN7UFY6_GIGMA|nr:17844_t:CDS:2 [Gigaspora margarita]